MLRMQFLCGMNNELMLVNQMQEEALKKMSKNRAILWSVIIANLLHGKCEILLLGDRDTLSELCHCACI